MSCVWSCAPRTALLYPARSLFTFLDHHGCLERHGSPSWRTVVGGSRSYVERAAKELTADRALDAGAQRRSHRQRGIEIRDDADDLRTFDDAVVATHADEALATARRTDGRRARDARRVPYSVNETVMHTDGSVLPRARARPCVVELPPRPGARRPPTEVQVSYDMNRLHRLDEPLDYVVTLNGGGRVAEARVLARMSYTHPVYTAESVAAQRGSPS